MQYDVFVSYAHQPPANTAWVKQHVHAPVLAATHADGTPLKVFFDEGSIDGPNRFLTTHAERLNHIGVDHHFP